MIHDTEDEHSRECEPNSEWGKNEMGNKLSLKFSKHPTSESFAPVVFKCKLVVKYALKEYRCHEASEFSYNIISLCLTSISLNCDVLMYSVCRLDS